MQLDATNARADVSLEVANKMKLLSARVGIWVLLASESNLCKRPTGIVGDVDSTPEPERVLGLVGDWVGEDDGLGTVEWTQGGGEGDVGLRVPIVPGRKHGVACSIITRARAGVSMVSRAASLQEQGRV